MIIERKVRLTYPQHLLDRPLIYGVIRQFDVLANILEARVTPEEGWLILAVRGQHAHIEQAIAWIVEQGVQVEALGEVEQEGPEESLP